MTIDLDYDGQSYQAEFDYQHIRGEQDVGTPDHTEITLIQVWANLPAPWFKGGEVIVSIYSSDIEELDLDASQFTEEETIKEEIRKYLNK